MNTDELRDLLVERATDIDGAPVDRVSQVRGRVRATRRNRALAAAALATVVGVGVGIGVGTPGDDTQSDGPAQEGPTDAATYDVLPAAAEPTRLVPGEWGIPAIGSSSAPLAVVDVPGGFFGGGSWLFDRKSSDTALSQDAGAIDGPQFRSVGFWTPTGVYENPCTDAGGLTRVDSVTALADALAQQRLSTTTRAVPVTVDGHDGLYVELTAPSDLDISADCKDGVFDVFETDLGTRWMNTPGMVDHYWIVWDQGDLLMLATSTGPQVGAARTAELADIAGTARFVQPAAD